MTVLDRAARRERWVPAPRPDWLAKVNAEGACFNLNEVVPLDARSLLETAVAGTGLDDFGADGWREPFHILTKALDEESGLTLMGRLMTRAQLLVLLEARLRIEDTYKRHPEIDDEIITAPLMIVGQGRTGTSVLQGLLAADPCNGTTRTWEVTYPCPPPEADTYDTDPRIAQADGLVQQYHRCAPEVASMHTFGGWEPTECVHTQGLDFRSGPWFDTIVGQVPSYTAYMAGQDITEGYRYEKRLLKLLQWRNPRRTWVLKSPFALTHLPSVLEVYPDAGIVWTHRDPVKALASMVNLIGTLQWIRSDHPFIGDSVSMFTRSDLSAAMMTQPISWLESGALPAERLCNVHYADFVKDPMGVVAQIYRAFDLELSPDSRDAMQNYMDRNQRSGHPAHDYDLGSDHEVQLERQAFMRYQTYFDVKDEI